MSAHRHTRLATSLLASVLAACGAEPPPPRPQPPAADRTPPVDTALLHEQVRAALLQVPEARVIHAIDGYPAFVRGPVGRIRGWTNTGRLTDALTQDAVAAVAPLYRLEPRHLRVRGQERDRTGTTHLRLEQVHQGLPVVGAEVVVHVKDDGGIAAINGLAAGGYEASAPDQARVPAAARAAAAFPGAEIHGERLVYLLRRGQGLRLSWEITLTPAKEAPLRAYLDALDGSILRSEPLLRPLLSRQVYDLQATSSFVNLRRAEGNAPSGDPSVDGNYDALGVTYTCYRNLFGRDSYDSQGGALVTGVHKSKATFGGKVNAAWEAGLNRMVFTDGEPGEYGDPAQSLDVVAHELTHGVTEKTSNLTYTDEPGALNESFSDVISAVCKAYSNGGINSDTWHLGSDYKTPGVPGDAVRYMDNPTQDGSSTDYYPQRYTGDADYGGVHRNSGIGNHAFYLATVGGAHRRVPTGVTVPALGIDVTRDVWYYAFAYYLTSQDNYVEARLATVEVALDLYGLATGLGVQAAWDAVGVPTGISFSNRSNQSDIGAGATALALLAADVDHDERSDVVQVYRNGAGRLGVIMHRGTAWGQLINWGVDDTLAPAPTQAVYLMLDATGDGRADLVQLWNNNGRLAMNLFTATPLSPSQTALGWSWSRADVGAGFTSLPFLPIDYNGDGLTDIVQLWNNNGRLAYIVHQAQPGGSFAIAQSIADAGAGAGALAFLVGDYDGDGRKDILQLWDNGGRLGLIVHRGTGSGFALTFGSSDLGAATGDSRYLVDDFDGDFKSDLIQLYRNGSYRGANLFRSTGTAYTLWRSYPWLTSYDPQDRFFAGNLNATGRAGLLRVFPSLGRVSMSSFLMFNGQLRFSWSTTDAGPWGTTLDWLAVDNNGDYRLDLLQLRNNGGRLGAAVYAATDALPLSHF